MSRDRPARPVALITGASRGICAETARQLAHRGYALVLAARSEDALSELARELNHAGAESMVVVTDVRNCSELRQLVACTLERFRRVDVLLHNAGVVYPGVVLPQLSDGDVRSIIATNLPAGIELTRPLLPSMLAQGSGFIGFVDSVGGHIGLPSATVYCAAKFGIRGFAAALRREVKPQGLHVCVISPGFIKTKLTEPVAEILNGYPVVMGKPESVARAIVKCIDHPRRKVILAGYNRVFVWAEQNVPFAVDALASFYMRRILPRYRARQGTESS